MERAAAAWKCAMIGLVVSVALLAAYFQMWGAARYQWPFNEGAPLHFISVMFPLE